MERASSIKVRRRVLADSAAVTMMHLHSTCGKHIPLEQPKPVAHHVASADRPLQWWDLAHSHANICARLFQHLPVAAKSWRADLGSHPLLDQQCMSCITSTGHVSCLLLCSTYRAPAK